jgi:hypothetical protein
MNKLLLSILLFSKIAYSQGIKNKLFSWTCPSYRSSPYWHTWTRNRSRISRPRIPRNCRSWIPRNCRPRHWVTRNCRPRHWVTRNCRPRHWVTRSWTIRGWVTRSRITRNRNSSSSFRNSPDPSPYRQCGN